MTEQKSFPIYRVFNQGDIPALADGWRSVIALHLGRKWVTLIDWTTLDTARVEIAVWEALKPVADKGINRRKVRGAMRQRLKYTPSTRTIAEAMRLLKDKTP
jgi:hypothetical protein